MTLKIKNNLQVHLLHLLEIEFDIELFTQLATLWVLDLSTKELVHRAYIIAGLIK